MDGCGTSVVFVNAQNGGFLRYSLLPFVTIGSQNLADFVANVFFRVLD